MEIERLIEQCRQGNKEALGNLYKAYAQRMRSICQRYVCDPQAVDDVLHDAFVVIFTSLDKLKDDTKAEAWMAGIVRNVALKYGKRLKVVKTISQEEVFEEILSTAAENDSSEQPATFEELMHMVDKLPDGYGKVFRLSVFEGLSHKEIAEHLGIEPHSSSSQLTRAKKMMRKMIKQYWLWLLIPLLIPVSWIILHYKQINIDKKITDIPQKPDVSTKPKGSVEFNMAELDNSLKDSSTKQSKESSIIHLPENLTLDISKGMIAHPQAITVAMPSEEKSDTLLPINRDSILTIPKVELPRYKNFVLRPQKIRNNKDWNLSFAYNGNVQEAKSQTNDYMTIPPLGNGTTRSTRLYDWGEYMEYVIENAAEMDSISAANMYRVAILNSNNPNDPLSETSKHERPLTLQLLFNRRLTNNWSITAGLSLTRMKSTFESGNDSTLICRTQLIQYLGIPIKANFRMFEKNHMNIYTSGGIQLDFPINAQLTTKYLYRNSYGHIGDSPDITDKIHTKCQLSFGVGIGIQYQVSPHINIFFEPSLNYYIPNGQGIETYRTEHPFELSLPVGVKISW